jgi:hypothetical protein
MPRPALAFTFLVALLGAAIGRGQTTGPAGASPDRLFAEDEVPRIVLTIPPEGLAQLRGQPREWVLCEIGEPGKPPLKSCHVKLKGSAGSFRPIDDPRPGFSLRTDRVIKRQELRGLGKFQLNNCAQDGTMLLETLAGDIARRAGVPASRCTHAHVTLNGRALGIYVLKEGFNREFLSRFFKDTRGHLYDGGFVSEINPGMELDRGPKENPAPLAELIAACREPDLAARARRLEAILDIDAYLRHLALESVFCHWDGYSFNRNNYRIYHDPSAGKFHFILHGMDQVFGDPRWYVFRRPSGLVGDAVWSLPGIQERYRQRFMELNARVLRANDWAREAERLAKSLQIRVKTASPGDAEQFPGRGQHAGNLIRNRLEQVNAQLEDAARLGRPGGSINLAKYAWAPSNGDKGNVNQSEEGGRPSLRIAANVDNGGDHRLALMLAPGRYRLSGMAQARDVKVAAGKGAGLRFRVSGEAEGAKVAVLAGTTSWRSLTHEFATTGPETTLLVELRAESGEAFVELKSLTLTRLP